MTGRRTASGIITVVTALIAFVVAAIVCFAWLAERHEAEPLDGFEFMGVNEFGLSEYKHRSTGIEFVRIDPEDQSARDVKYDWQIVEAVPFLIAKRKVSKRTYFVFCRPPGYTVASGDPNDPIEDLAFTDAKLFCDRFGFELPAVAQIRDFHRLHSQEHDGLEWSRDNSIPMPNHHCLVATRFARPVPDSVAPPGASFRPIVDLSRDLTGDTDQQSASPASTGDKPDTEESVPAASPWWMLGIGQGEEAEDE